MGTFMAWAIMSQLRATLPCLIGVVSEGDAHRRHGVQGLAPEVDGVQGVPRVGEEVLSTRHALDGVGNPSILVNARVRSGGGCGGGKNKPSTEKGWVPCSNKCTQLGSLRMRDPSIPCKMFL